MINIENTLVFGWEAAIRGMRNPKNSWDKSDTKYTIEFNQDIEGNLILSSATHITEIGKNDLKLMRSLSSAGNDHGKFLRMINVTMDITAPLYWWKEHDTYKVGTVADSCSTMHKIHDKEFTLDDFSYEHLTDSSKAVLDRTIDELNLNRGRFLETKDKQWWWQMIQLLPTSYNQRRTVQLNYQVLKTMYFARRNHKLDEWHDFCHWCETLPYFKEICVQD